MAPLQDLLELTPRPDAACFGVLLLVQNPIELATTTATTTMIANVEREGMLSVVGSL